MKNKTRNDVKSLTKVGITAALYVVLTLVVAPFSFGAFQFRVSEIFNHLIDFNKRYIWALTIGCAITNMASPLGPIDILVGTSGTLISGLLIYAINKHVSNLKAKLAVSTIIPTVIGMIPIALELHYVLHLPFWLTYGTSMVGEFISCLVGAFLVYGLSKRIDLTK